MRAFRQPESGSENLGGLIRHSSGTSESSEVVSHAPLVKKLLFNQSWPSTPYQPSGAGSGSLGADVQHSSGTRESSEVAARPVLAKELHSYRSRPPKPYPNQPFADGHFVERNRDELIQCVSGVPEVLNRLLGVALNEAEYQAIMSEPTDILRMEKLYELVPNWTMRCKDHLYMVLQVTNRSLIAKLAEVKDTQLTEKPTDLWEGVICDQCPREETFPEKTVPEIVIGHQMSHQTYRVVTTGAGILHCSYTDLIFEVTEAVTITYRVDSWYEHLEADETRELIIAGPLFNIQVDPVEAVAAAHFPHFLCLAGEDSSEVQIAHFSEGVMSLDNPDVVGPFHAVLKNPTFSPRGVLKSFSKRKTKVHAMALLYHLEAPGSVAHTLHLYLLPNTPCLKKLVLGLVKVGGGLQNSLALLLATNHHFPPEWAFGLIQPGFSYVLNVPHDIASLQEGENGTFQLGGSLAVEEFERNHHSRRILKPPVIRRPLRIGSCFFVQRPDDIAVIPKEYMFEYLDPDMEQQYFEVYAERMKGKLELSLMEKQDDEEEQVWETCVRQDELMQSVSPPPVVEASSELHFIEKHREKLIQRTSCVNPVLDKLLAHGILGDEQYQKVLSEKTNQSKMRELLLLLPSWNCSCKDQFYEALKSTNPFLIDDLESVVGGNQAKRQFIRALSL